MNNSRTASTAHLFCSKVFHINSEYILKSNNYNRIKKDQLTGGFLASKNRRLENGVAEKVEESVLKFSEGKPEFLEVCGEHY